MKAVVKHASGPGNIDVLDVDEPECGANQVKVEIAFCGVCGTDLHVLHDTFRNYPPVILGHECAGTVVEIGRSVRGCMSETASRFWAQRPSPAVTACTAALATSSSAKPAAGWDME